MPCQKLIPLRGLLLRFAKNLIGASESGFCDSVHILFIIEILNNQITRSSNHSFSPGSDKAEGSILVWNYHKTHLHPTWPINRPSISGCSANWPFVPL